MKPKATIQKLYAFTKIKYVTLENMKINRTESVSHGAGLLSAFIEKQTLISKVHVLNNLRALNMAKITRSEN